MISALMLLQIAIGVVGVMWQQHITDQEDKS